MHDGDSIDGSSESDDVDDNNHQNQPIIEEVKQDNVITVFKNIDRVNKVKEDSENGNKYIDMYVKRKNGDFNKEYEKYKNSY